MKKFLSIIFMAFAMIFVTGVSCEEEKPLCEQNNFCKVTIKNNTSIALWVDCTEDGDYYNSEKRLLPGTSYTYTMIPGNLTVWAASDAARQQDRWNYDEIYVVQCDEYSFTWNGAKGGEGVSFNDNDDYGVPKGK